MRRGRESRGEIVDCRGDGRSVKRYVRRNSVRYTQSTALYLPVPESLSHPRYLVARPRLFIFSLLPIPNHPREPLHMGDICDVR